MSTSKQCGAPGEPFRIGVRVTPAQFREISRRAGLGPVDGLARGEFLLGCALDEPRDQLLERVHRIAAEERARVRAEIQAQRARRKGQHSAGSAGLTGHKCAEGVESVA